MPRRPPQLQLLGIGLAASLLLAGCTSGIALGSSGTVTLSTSTPDRSGSSTHVGATSTSVTPTPVTPDGMLTGAGVDDRTIALGLLVDAAIDRGFSTGVQLWQQSVNKSGGICGRTIVIRAGATAEPLTDAYIRIAGSTLGLISLPAESDRAGLAARSAADHIPTLTLGGSSADLTRPGPVVVGATEDIKAVNGLAYLRSTGKLGRGSVLGTLTDSSTEGVNALEGARWWAARNDVTVQSRTPGGSTPAGWTGVDAVLVVADPAAVEATLAGTQLDVDVLTNLDGYQPTQVPNPDGRLLVSLAAPAYGSDNPGAAAVAKAFVADGRTDPGPDLMSGYGVAATWGRLLAQACIGHALTHAGVETAMTTVGPASVDSLFGPSDPALVVESALPATRVSSVALADPTAPAGLRPLIWLQSAPGIDGYLPTR